MANILFTWEIGEASGHIAPYINLIHLLEENGHTVYFALRSLANASRLLKDTNAIYLQAPALASPPNDILSPIDSYSKILHNSGYSRATQISSLITAWQNLFDLVKPDLIIFDFSPTAMLASRQLPVKRLQIGTGFFSPPDSYPIPGLETLQGQPQDLEKLKAFEDAMLDTINEALTAVNMHPIKKFADIQMADEQIFLSFKEFEHYPTRTNARYLGVLKAPPGLKPQWPDMPGPRIFMYLKPFPTLQAFLKLINERNYPALIYADGVSEKTKKNLTSHSMHFLEKPLDMGSIGETADVAICNGNHGTIAELLLSGIPMLLIPLHAEQNICSLNIERIGAGLSAPKKHPESMRKKLDALINDPRYREAAQAFSKRYADYNNDTINNQVFNTITTLLNGRVLS